ncbi:hypothetical protein M7I_8335 [Glarea lozoyensis 74030]|uniref:Bacteriophage T5 Orf172 DNA-binding domain-containing protein n=1 Tax=Glarea lozoyensis (strain ATCC 74030 / MF5533) TaxID=1104152 RepID=H0EZQ8_GLAL7|nr:hypothetical protein M7I_8335 [Glarea lozoyensis 74030]
MPSSYPSPANAPPPERLKIDSDPARRNERSPTRSHAYIPVTPSAHPPAIHANTPPTSTSKTGSVSVVKATAVPAPMSFEGLKKELNLGTGKCGSPTKKEGNPPCKNPNPGDIGSQIKSMTALTQASAELPRELEKLAELALCKHHIIREKKAARIKLWKKGFPIGDEKAVPLEPITDRIKSAKQDSDTPCLMRIGGKRALKGKRTIALIIEPDNYPHEDELTCLLKVLASNVICHHHKGQIPDVVAQWKHRITMIYEAYPAQEQPLKSTYSTGFLRRLKGDPAKFWDDADDKSAFRTEIEKDRPSDDLACYSLIQHKIMEPLKKSELVEGYVYAYEVEGNEGFVKIGYTTRPIEVRSAEWKVECDRAPKVLYPLGPTEKIPHANRVEGLCLAELKHRNMTVICEACPKRHIEWVKTPAAEAITVIQKWTNWILTAPYNDSKRQPSQWEVDNEITSWNLRDEEEKRTGDMLNFMDELLCQEATIVGGDSDRKPCLQETSARGRRYQKRCLQ